MLDGINSQSNRLRKADRAEMAGHFHAALMGLVHYCLKDFLRDLGVYLDPFRALVGPMADYSPRFGLVSQARHAELVEVSISTHRDEIWTSEVHPGPRHVAPVDPGFQVDLGIRRKT